MEIRIEDYVSESQIEKIVIDEIKDTVRKQTKDNIERILTNSSFYFIEESINEVFGQDHKEFLKVEVLKRLEKIDFNIFRAPNAWDREASVGWKILQDEVKNSRGLIKEKIKEGVDKGTLKYIKEQLPDLLTYGIMDLLKERDTENE